MNDLVFDLDTMNMILALCYPDESGRKSEQFVHLINIIKEHGPIRFMQIFHKMNTIKPRSYISHNLRKLIEMGFIIKIKPTLPEQWERWSYGTQKMYMTDTYNIKSLKFDKIKLYAYEPSKIIRKLVESQGRIQEFIDMLVPVEPYPFSMIAKEVEV